MRIIHTLRRIQHGFFVFIFCFVGISIANAQTNHWETAVYAGDNWRYFRGTQQPNTNWNNLQFSANSWQQGPGGIGFGDGDDATTVSGNITSLYVRKTFTVADTAQITRALLDIDYDDAFVAYINGVEVARNNVGNPANYNTLAFGEHEAVMYSGGSPERYEIPKTTLNNCLVNGANLLAIQVHNASANSSDMSCLPWLSFGVIDESVIYGPTPAWFQAPFEFYSSTLPIFVINTNGNAIVDDPRTTVDLGIIDNGVGQLNHPTDTFNNYSGKITIEYRGSSTQGFPKKQYGFSTVNADGMENNVSLLGYPKENDWILNAPYTDKTMMREFLTYNWARNMGQYATRTRFCELIIDGQYQGVYMLLEKIKWDNGRVDIPEMDQYSNVGDDVTGGYIFKVDKFTGSGGQGWSSDVTNFQGINKNIYFQYHYPQPEDITQNQEIYLQQFVDSFEANLNSSNFNNPNNGYHKFIDVQSFIDFFLLNEITKNVDGYRLSTFFHKQRESLGGKLFAGPVWDFNITLGNADYCAGDSYTGWALDFPCDQSVIPFWWHRLQQDTAYVKLLNCRWQELRGGILNTQTILNSIDSLATKLEAPQQRNYQIWPILGTYIWPNAYVGQTYQDEIDFLKQWLTNRLNWMDANLPTIGPNGQPQCASVQAGSVVVSEINYHSDNGLDSGDWFELYNTTNQAVDVSNWTFKDGNVGNSYTFPLNTTIAPNGYLVLAENTALFQQIHPGVSNVIGPFNFGFGNSGDEINLFDAISNPVLSMAFADSMAWPDAPDGFGYTLELLDANGNPNDGANWFPGCVGGSPGAPYSSCSYPIVFSEINYNSSVLADADDWVELHNTTNEPIYIGAYTFLDENDTLPFIMPGGTIIEANGYLVLYRNSALFSARHANVTNKVGPFQFGLGGGGDACRLYDQNGKLVMSVYYDDEDGWPTEPDGNGYTLELLSDTGKMSTAGNWFAGCPEGSPGYPYSSPCGVGIDEENVLGLTVFPNPFANSLVIQWNATTQANTVLEAFDMYGKKVAAHAVKSTVGKNRFDANLINLSAGIYMVRIVINGQGTSAVRVIKQ